MSTTKSMWLIVVLIPMFLLLGQSMCVWPFPRILGEMAMVLLQATVFTGVFVIAAAPASVYFAVSGFVYWKKDGELARRMVTALACVCFIGLWILAFWLGLSLRHRAFDRASRFGDHIVQALAQFRNDKGEYPDRLDQLIPAYLKEIPYTGMIAYPNFDYTKDYNDTEPSPGEYELRIRCSYIGLNWDRFIYWPSENYPDQILGSGVERIRTWAYLHE